MAFWKRKQETPVVEQEHRDGRIMRIYENPTIHLTLAQMSFTAGYGIGYDGREIGGPSNYAMRGIVHRIDPQPNSIRCDVEFVDQPRTDDSIGSCSLQYTDGKPAQERGLLLEVRIFDPGRVHSLRAYESLRDAAISGAKFLHVLLETNKMDANAALQQIREKRFGPL